MAERVGFELRSPFILRKLLILHKATIARAATVAQVGYSFGTHSLSIRKIVLFLALFLPGFVSAQSNSQFISLVLGPTGRPAAGVQVTVCSNVLEMSIPCTSTVNIFDSTGAGISNPALTDGKGNLNFWAPVGVYLLTFTGSQITPYRLVVNLPGGGGGGSGTVGPCTTNFMAKFTSVTGVGCSSVTDDGTTPTRTPNGTDSATGGFWIERVVDTGGVVQGKLACRSSVKKVVICPAGTQLGVLGVAGATVAAGGTVESALPELAARSHRMPRQKATG
jgi:hypothetical protein